MTLGIYCPTYKRPDKLQAVATNIEQATRSRFKLYWGCEPNDPAGIAAAKATGHPVIINKYSMGYADTVQTIYERSRCSVFFTANDDFFFVDGWDVAPMRFLVENPEIMVLGVHDGTSTTNFYTTFFVRRKYIMEQSGVVDMPNRVFYPYSHNYTDTEFSQTAIKRAVWDKLESPCIEHRRFGHDETYAKNGATFPADREIYERRKRLFWN